MISHMNPVIQKLNSLRKLPIQINDIRDLIIENGYQDKIVFSKQACLDPQKLRGVCYQWREHGSVYGEPIWVTLIAYPQDVDTPTQRLICAKELIHIFDHQIVKTQTAEMVYKLAEKVISEMRTELDTPENLMAAVDNLAAYQGINLLFPLEARAHMRAELSADRETNESIARKVDLPVETVKLVMPPTWEKMTQIMSTLINGNGKFDCE